jgi:chromosome segregation protein
LRSDLAAFDADSAAAALKALAGEDERLDQEAQEVFAAHDRAARQRVVLEQGVGAEVAVQQRRNAEAELALVAREWAVLKLGSLLIGSVVDRYRASQQDPLITRAGVLFETLTGGAFTGIGQDYDDEDVPRLVGHRKSGGMVSVPGMSDGTRDQLYLALRLAYLEDYASRAESIPFIGDDLFTTFDDARTAHALAALAAIGERVQPILFTHHMHVVDTARIALGECVDIVDLGVAGSLVATT